MANRKKPATSSSAKKRKHSDAEARNLFEPVGVYVVSRQGVGLSVGTTEGAKWRDLEDVGRRLSCARLPRETLREYARRLWVKLEPLKRDQFLDGAAVYMLRHIVNLYLRDG